MFIKLDIYNCNISGFIIIKIIGIKWINKDVMIFCGVWIEYNISGLLWIIEINIIRENEVAINDIIKIIIIELLFHNNILDIIIISLKVLIVGGAEMFIAININHQKVILGISKYKPLNNIIFRVWYLKYKSFTRRNNADEDIPWAIIIIKAPIKPILFIENNPIKMKPIWATEE